MNSKYFPKLSWGKRLIDEPGIVGLNKLPYNVPSVPYISEAQAMSCDFAKYSYYYSLSAFGNSTIPKAFLTYPMVSNTATAKIGMIFPFHPAGSYTATDRPNI